MLLLQGTSKKTAVLFAQVNISWQKQIIRKDLNVRGSTSTIITLSRLESIRMNLRWKVSSTHVHSSGNPLEWQFPSEFQVYFKTVIVLGWEWWSKSGSVLGCTQVPGAHITVLWWESQGLLRQKWESKHHQVWMLISSRPWKLHVFKWGTSISQQFTKQVGF